MDELQEIIDKNPLLAEIDISNIHPIDPSSVLGF